MAIINIYIPDKAQVKFLSEFDDGERKAIRKEASDLMVKQIEGKVQ